VNKCVWTMEAKTPAVDGTLACLQALVARFRKVIQVDAALLIGLPQNFLARVGKSLSSGRMGWDETYIAGTAKSKDLYCQMTPVSVVVTRSALFISNSRPASKGAEMSMGKQTKVFCWN